MRPLVLLAACASAAVLVLACSHAPAGGASDGERLYRSKCAGCHRAYPPDRLTAQGWAEVLDRMAPRARLTAAERDAVQGWLTAHAKGGPAR
jgi:mono/diheme cytochrome c family protein